MQLERLRRKLHGEGLFDRQKRLARSPLPRTIGVVTGERGKARDDVLAGLIRRGCRQSRFGDAVNGEAEALRQPVSEWVVQLRHGRIDAHCDLCAGRRAPFYQRL